VKLHRRRGRRAAGLALLEGPHLVEEAVAGGADLRTVFHLPDDRIGPAAAARAGADAVPVTEAVLRRLATTEHPQSPVVVIAVGRDEIPDAGDLVVVWGVGDPGNVGTLLRTAAAFRMGFVAGPGSADVWSPKVLRAAAGAHFRTTVGTAADLDDLGGRVAIATVASGGRSPEDLPPQPVAVIVGDEASGLPTTVVDRCALRVTIPMPGGTESLNAAVAGAVVAYEAARRRGGAGAGGH
jgi:TrmH family RNA methyltransferase